MTYDDNIPENDAVANRARHALHQMGGARPIELSWADVEQGARRVRQKRLSMLGAACAIVVVAATAAVAAVGGDGRSAQPIAGEPTTTSTAATTTSVAPVFGTSSVPTLPPITVPPATAPPAGPEPVILNPQVGNWHGSMGADATRVNVGDTVTVYVVLRNTGTQLQRTREPGSQIGGVGAWITITCGRDWPVGRPVEEVVMSPGESRLFSLTFRAEAEYAGIGECTTGIAFDNDLPWAGQPPAITADSVTIEIVGPPPDTTTSTTTDTVPTTETSAP